MIEPVIVTHELYSLRQQSKLHSLAKPMTCCGKLFINIYRPKSFVRNSEMISYEQKSLCETSPSVRSYFSVNKVILITKKSNKEDALRFCG